MPLEHGNILNDRYRILSILGQGGFGAVYRAADMTLKRPCAVKENLDTTEDAQRQFEKEAIVLAQLAHPNLPRVQDHFTIPGQGQYLVMDFVDGEDLQTIIAQGGRIDPETALDWIGQIASALTYLHHQKPPVIHRDIKPANIKVTEDGRAFLVDFGLVKIFDPHLRTTVGARAVTPGYSPPEQYGQGNTDVRTDIYALGATLYTLLTGLEPQESVQRVVEDQLIPVQAANARVRGPIASAIRRAMDLRPSKRYGNVGDFEQALTGVEELDPHKALTVEVPRQDMTVQVALSDPEPVPIEAAASTPLHVEREIEASQPKPIWKQPWLYLGVVVAVAICSGLGYAGYQMIKPEETKATVTKTITRTPNYKATGLAEDRATEAKRTQDAVGKQEESKPTNTKRPTLPPTKVPTDTKVPTERPTRTLQPSVTNTSAPPPSYFVIDSWCNSHEGCATVDVRNQSGMNSSWHISNKDFGVDSSFTLYPGPATIVTRPGKYQFYITYCGGEVADFSWQLNNKWWYKLPKCD